MKHPEIGYISMKLITSLLPAALLLSTACLGQAVNVNDYHFQLKSDKTPGAASLLEYNNLDVDLYHGLANINIPLLNINYGGINVPINISYHSGGVKIQEMPGWMGLNWNLFCGGEISRKVNRVADEFDNIESYPTFTDKGYYRTRSQLQTPNWNTTAFMDNAIDLHNITSGNTMTTGYNELVLDGEPDEFVFNFGPYSGSFYLNAEGQWKVKSKQNLHLEISEEHYFVRDAPNNRYEFFGSPDSIGISAKPNNLFTKFTIITPDGFKYTFGGISHALEFSRNLFRDPNLYIGENNHLYNFITAHTWKLTCIEAPTGEQVVFNYRRGRPVFKKGKLYASGYRDGPNYGYPAQMMYPMTVINPSYLQSIETQAKRIEFKGSKATELEITNEFEPLSGRNPYNYSAIWPDFPDENSYISQNNKLPHNNEQLDSIKVYNKLTGQYETGYKFFFSANGNRRRTLDSLKPISLGVPVANPGTYIFSYSNVDQLPGYESLRKDYWGYFNGGISEPAYQATRDFNDMPSRVAQSPFCLYGLMNKITYPTGGTTEFEYENNGYDATVKVNPSLTTPVYLEQHTPTAGSGARIKKITSKAGYNSPEMTREFFYTKNYLNGGTGSSGILGGIPDRIDQVTYHVDDQATLFFGIIHISSACAGDFQLFNYSDDNSEWMDMIKGGFVNYSEVTEKKSGEGYIVYNYANHDQQQYRDEIHDNYVGRGLLSQSNYRLTSNELERGKILKEAYYNSAQIKTRDISYEYRDLPARKNEFIKNFAHKRLFTGKKCAGQGSAENVRAWTYKVYCYQNPLKKVTETNYENGNAITRTSEFVYDEYGNKVSSVTQASDGKLLTETTKFNSSPDLTGPATNLEAQAIARLYTNYKIKNYPVEQLTLLGSGPNIPGGDKIIKGSLFHYDPDKPLLFKVYALELNEPFAPVTYNGSMQPIYHFNHARIVNGGLEMDYRYKLQSLVSDYTAVPAGTLRKPAEIRVKDNPTAYTWDHLAQYNTSITKGSYNDLIAFTSFEGQYKNLGIPDQNKGNWDIDNTKIVSGGFTGSKCLNLSVGEALKTKQILLPNTRYRLTFWSSGATPRIKLGNTAIIVSYATIKTSGNWHFYTIDINGTGELLSIIPDPGSPYPTIKLDEVRLHPESASMSSYNYNGTGKVLSITDETEQLSFYEYDGLDRLIYIRDHKKNIVKRYTYQTQGAQ
jgi:YD repeat-containing protein